MQRDHNFSRHDCEQAAKAIGFICAVAAAIATLITTIVVGCSWWIVVVSTILAYAVSGVILVKFWAHFFKKMLL